jgi:ketosteroid isomerase-like protein
MATSIDRAAVDRWLDDYVAAWKSYDREAISALFADDVDYRYHPYDEPIRGRDAVVESWLGEGDHEDASTPDEPGTYEASYRAVAVDGDTAVAVGTSSYRSEPGGPVDKVYDNCYLIRYDGDGRCREFTEWYMQRPGG